MRSVCRMILLAGLACWTASPARAAAPERARILAVQHATLADTDSGRAMSIFTPRMGKFSNINEGIPREVYTVLWLPPRDGTAPGTMVTFEYRQERAPSPKFLFIRYPFVAQGERKAVFEIARDARRVGGPVTAWRARVVHSGRLLAELTSDTWR